MNTIENPTTHTQDEIDKMLEVATDTTELSDSDIAEMMSDVDVDEDGSEMLQMTKAVTVEPDPEIEEEIQNEDDIQNLLEELESESALLDISFDDVNAVVEKQEAPKPAPKKRGRKPSNIEKSDVGSIAFKSRLGSKWKDAMSFDVTKPMPSDQEIEEFFETLDDLPKKVRLEKVPELAECIVGLRDQKKISVYTRIAIQLLIDQEGEMTIEQLQEHYSDVYLNGIKSYRHGTCMAQAGQMKHALPALGICRKVGARLIVDEDSVYWTLLMANWESSFKPVDKTA